MMTTASAAQNAASDLPLPPAPFLSSVMQIEPQWIDYNGHLNMAYYNVMMDRAIDQMWLHLGIGPGYMTERHGSTFTAECHVRYLREIHLGDPVQITVYLLAADEKRLHTFEELRDATEAQNTRDQRDDQKRYDPTQHDTTSIWFDWRDRTAPWPAETIHPGSDGSWVRNPANLLERRN